MKASTIAIIGLGVLAIAAMSRRQNQTAASNQNAITQAASDPLVSGNYSNEQQILNIIAGSNSTAEALEGLAFMNMDADSKAVYDSLTSTPTDATNRIATTTTSGEPVILTQTGQWINGQFVAPNGAYDLDYLHQVQAAVPINTTPHYVEQWEYDIQARLYSSQLEKARNSINPERRAYFEQIAARSLAQLNAMVVRQ